MATLRLQDEAHEGAQSVSPEASAPGHLRQPPSSMDGLEFEPNQSFSERYMPMCLAYGSGILLTGALETVAALFSSSDSPRRTGERVQRYVIDVLF
jgi:hypothetical protein